jgi:hypothetical protein
MMNGQALDFIDPEQDYIAIRRYFMTHEWVANK